MSGEADRARGAEAAAAVEGGERPPVPVERDGALRPAVGTGDQGAGDGEDIDSTGRLRPGHGIDRLVETGDGHGVGGLAIQKPGRPRPAARDAESGIVQLPARLGDVVPGGIRVGGRAVEGAERRPSRRRCSTAPRSCDRWHPARAGMRTSARDRPRRCARRPAAPRLRRCRFVGALQFLVAVELGSAAIARTESGRGVRRASVPGADVAAMEGGRAATNFLDGPRPVASECSIRHSRRRETATVQPVARVGRAIGELQAGRVLRVCAHGHRSHSVRSVRGIPPHSPSLWL